MRQSGRIHYAEEGGETPAVNANFPTYKKEPDWTFNALALREDMFRWNAVSAERHENSALVVESTRKCANEKITEQTVTTKGSEDFGIPIYIGQASDPEVEIKDAFTKWPKMHVRTEAVSTETSDKSWALIDAPTGRVVEPGGVTKVGSVWTSATTSHGHDLNRGCGYSANRTEKPTLIPFPPESAEDKARSAGGTVTEAGGSSSARMCPAPLVIRFPSLKRASANWEDAIPHPLAMLIQGGSFGTKKGGMAPRTATPKYGYGIVGEPTDGRLPFTYPGHQGESAENGCKEAAYKDYAPPNGCWSALNWSKATISGNGAPAWVKAVQWAWRTKGAFMLDVQGSEGITFRWESPKSYLGSTYATDWLEELKDGVWLKKIEAGKWKIDLTGGGLITAKSYFDALEILAPPAKPADLPS